MAFCSVLYTYMCQETPSTTLYVYGDFPTYRPQYPLHYFSDDWSPAVVQHMAQE